MGFVVFLLVYVVWVTAGARLLSLRAHLFVFLDILGGIFIGFYLILCTKYVLKSVNNSKWGIMVN